jgi:hypothetical protein
LGFQKKSKKKIIPSSIGVIDLARVYAAYRKLMALGRRVIGRRYGHHGRLRALRDDGHAAALPVFLG